MLCIFVGHILQNIYGPTNEDLEADSYSLFGNNFQ